MNIRDEIDVKERAFKDTHDKLPEKLLIDAYFLSELATELGYSEDEVLIDFSILESYKGYEIGILEDEGSDVIKFV
jgi:hypothetical protein